MKLDKFVENGYVIVDDFLPVDIAHQLEYIFTEHENWELIDQYRDKKYGSGKYGHCKTGSHFSRPKTKYILQNFGEMRNWNPMRILK